MARVIVVTSGKGGVGKTTVTAGLGRALAKRGKRVVLMDADLGLNNLDVVLDAESRVVYDILDVVENRCRPRQALDFIFIDCPAGIEAGFHRAVAAADEALIVTTPHVSALRDADKVVAIVKSYGIKAGLVINRARGDMILGQEQLGCEDISELLQLVPVGVLPEDDAINTYNCFLTEENGRSEGDEAIGMLADNLLNGTTKLYDVTKKYRGFLGGIKRSLKKIV